jgi:hypothetical protein
MTTSLEKAYATTADTGSHAQLPGAPVVFTTQAEIREQLVSITRATERHLAIWSDDLKSGLLDNPGFLEAVKRFVLARRHARVRILTRSLPAAGTHALLTMAERLPASFEIRALINPCLDAADLLLSDERGVLYRIHSDRWDGMADVNDPLVARFYTTQFDADWRLAHPADRLVGV